MDCIWNTYEDMNEIIYVADMDTYDIVYLNRRTRELYGITSLEQIRGKKCYEFLQNNSRPCAMCTNQKLLQNNCCEWEYYNSYIGKIFQLKDQMIVYNGRRLRIEVATEHKDEISKAKSGQGMENMMLLINECMRMALQESDPNQGIKRLLEYLGQALNGGRAYIFELSDRREWNNTYEWCAYNVSAEIDFLQNISYHDIDVWLTSFEKNQFVVIRDVDATKESDPTAYAYLQPQDIHSIIVGPLHTDGVLSGFYGIDNPPVEKIDEAVTMIRTISHVIENMISKRELMKKLEDLSYHDQMLKLGNRHAMHRYLDSVDRNSSIGIVYCDVCGLKRVNDTMGHAAGDELLLHACECLRGAFPNYELYRIGGDEMLALVSGIDKTTFEEHCRNLRVRMLEKDIPLAVGSVWSSEIGENAEDLIGEADAKMYQDKVHFYKSTGLNRWRSNSAWFGTTTRYEEIVECVNSGLEKALNEGQFVIYYQPQYNQRDYSLYGAEVLVRWKHPQKGIISPAKFVPYLEQNGMISKLDEFVLKEACRYQKLWLDRGMKVVPISVNLSRVDLQSEEICYRISETLKSFDLTPEYINLEVTESAYMENPETVIDVVKKFQELGFKVEMDDFGSGYSSLNSLKDIPVDILKLDMKFVEGDSISERSGKILSSVTRMAHGLGMPVIAEGVETREQAEFLSAIGCFYVQGYYFDRPIPVEEFEERLLNARPDLQRDGRVTRKNEKSINYFAAEGTVSLLLEDTFGAAGVIEYDGKNIELIRSNKALYEMFDVGWNGKEHFAYTDILYKDNDENYLGALNRAVESMDSSECITQNVKLSNPDRPFWTRTRFKYLYGYDGDYTFYMTVENIDDEKNAKQINTNLFKVMESLEQNGAFGAMMLQIGEPDRITYFNITAASVLGYEEEEYRELVNKDAYISVFPEDRKVLKAAVCETFETGSGMMSCSVRYICKNGQIKNIPVLGLTGSQSAEKKYMRLILVDRPDLALMAAQILAADAREQEIALRNMKMVAETIGGAYVCCSMKEQMILDVSKDMIDLLEIPSNGAGRLQYSSLEGIVWPHDWGYVHRMLLEAQEQHRTKMELEFRICAKGDKQKWVHAVYYMITKVNGREDMYLTFTEVDDLQRLKRQLQQQEHMNRLIEANPTVGVVYYQIVGKRWKIDYVSDGNFSILGYTRKQMFSLISNDLLALIHPEDREKLRQYAAICLKERKDYKISYRMMNARGEYIGILTYASFLEKGDELYLCQTNIDISQTEAGNGDHSFKVHEI